jgi:diguanylate cyclase (GGDEF)-like protein
MSSTLLASYVVQAVGSLFTAVLFGVFARTYRKPFLVHWARAWSAMCIMMVGAALTTMLRGTPPDSFSRITISLVTSIAAYMQVAWLVLGTAELLSTERAQRLHHHRVWVFGSAIAIGVATVLLFANDPNLVGMRFVMRIGVRAAFTALAFLAAAGVVWATRTETLDRSLGRGLVAGSFLLFGVTQFHLSYSTFFRIAAISTPAYSLFASFFDAFLVFCMGLGVVIWLLEEEHGKVSTNAHEIAQLAFHDPLTQLPNRKLLLDHLSLNILQSRREKERLAVFFIDLDRFKVINDSLGHSAGDKVLQAVAARVKCTMREADSVGRMGGDEFVIVTPQINGVEGAVHIAQKVRDAIREPINVDGRELFVSASMGIAMYPNDGDNAETLLKNADTAMYRAKAGGSDLFQLYTPEMNAHATEQLALETALRRSVEAREFELHYQPIVQTADGHITGLETMLRWRHPVLGLVRPEQFIRLAETSGMIVDIGYWAMQTACKHLAELRAGGYPELRLAVNISARQLKQPDIVDRVRVILAETAIPGHALELEIPEMGATQSEPAIVDRLRGLRSMGVRISIDDFGTGFSSLSVLRHFPVDTLKIDTSFVRDLVLDPNDAAIAIAVISLAKSMGLTVIAEGVENPAQLDFLREQGCEMWQGYLCCPPVPTSEVRSVLGRRSGTVPRMRASSGADVESVKH